LLIAGWDDEGPQLYQVDPSGSYWAWKASAIGKNMVNAKTFLEKRYNDDIELEDAIHTAILTLKEGFEGEMVIIYNNYLLKIFNYFFRTNTILKLVLLVKTRNSRY
jgi:20S proteasome alpha/beta subunit